MAVQEKLLAKKPNNLSFEAAAALPMAAVTALQGQRNQGKLQAGQSVLINGASGGVGSYAIQIAKAMGATVTAVCSAGKMESARQHGADAVIDYRQQNFTQGDQTYDLIFDVAGNHRLADLTRVIKPGGAYVACAFSPETLFLGWWKSARQGKRFVSLLANVNQADLQYIAKLAEEEKLIPAVQKTFSLDDTPEALHLIGQGHAVGKLVVMI